MPSKNLKWLYLVILALIWGSSFILIKRGLLGLTAFQLGSLRIVFTSVFLLAIGFRSLPTIPRHKWKHVALTALCGTFLPVYLFSVAQTEISSSVSSILNSLTPVNTLLLGVLAFGLSLKRAQFFGVAIGLVGSALLIFNGAVNNPQQNYWYAILILLASLGYAINVNLIKQHLSDLSPLAITTGNFILMLFPALGILMFSDFFDVVHQPQVQRATYFVIVLAVLGTGIANLIFYKLVQMSSPVFATSVTYLIPVVAFFWGLLDNESLTPVQFLGAFIILIGVYLAGKK